MDISELSFILLGCGHFRIEVFRPGIVVISELNFLGWVSG